MNLKGCNTSYMDIKTALGKKVNSYLRNLTALVFEF